MQQHVFIIGSKGIPANYGGFESFVDKLTEYRKSPDITYHVACMGEDSSEFTYHNAHCFHIKVPNIGAAKAVYYDIAALRYCLAYIKSYHIQKPVLYILACRIGPFIRFYKQQLRQLGGFLYINPDGHEWLRAKWNILIRRYWKVSERLMVKHADLLICDSKHIEFYIKDTYRRYHPNTTFIAYGAELSVSTLKDDSQELLSWYQAHQISKGMYYLIVGRFVPENNYETMIREFMKSETDRDLVIISNIEKNRFYEMLKEQTHFETDKRIKFVGTVYNQELLKKIRENAYGYLHGHEVGGTNPSLLEALGSTSLNLLLDCGFNREVGEDGALYWSKEPGDLSTLINKADFITKAESGVLRKQAHFLIEQNYSWNSIINSYETVFTTKQNLQIQKRLLVAKGYIHDRH